MLGLNGNSNNNANKNSSDGGDDGDNDNDADSDNNNNNNNTTNNKHFGSQTSLYAWPASIPFFSTRATRCCSAKKATNCSLKTLTLFNNTVDEKSIARPRHRLDGKSQVCFSGWGSWGAATTADPASWPVWKLSLLPHLCIAGNGSTHHREGVANITTGRNCVMFCAMTLHPKQPRRETPWRKEGSVAKSGMFAPDPRFFQASQHSGDGLSLGGLFSCDSTRGPSGTGATRLFHLHMHSYRNQLSTETYRPNGHGVSGGAAAPAATKYQSCQNSVGRLKIFEPYAPRASSDEKSPSVSIHTTVPNPFTSSAQMWMPRVNVSF